MHEEKPDLMDLKEITITHDKEVDALQDEVNQLKVIISLMGN